MTDQILMLGELEHCRVGKWRSLLLRNESPADGADRAVTVTSAINFHTRHVVDLTIEGCIVLNEHNTVFVRSGPLYATGVSLGKSESSTQTTSRSLQLFLQVSLGDRPTDRPTDNATEFAGKKPTFYRYATKPTAM